ncbi:MAG: hypothetical protein ACR2P0_11975 [Acidimicrobiales bacterium]
MNGPATRGAGPPLLIALVGGFATACSLLLPWITTGSRSRSTISLIGSAGALDIITGVVRVAIVVLWLAVPVAVAVAGLAAASGRHRPSAFVLFGVGLSMSIGIGALLVTAAEAVAWGAWVSGVFALATAASSMMVLRRA